jgi:hypothetical protein
MASEQPGKNHESAAGSFIGNAVTDVANFTEGFYGTSIEVGMNEVIREMHTLTKLPLPELHLVDKNRLEQTNAGTAGEVAGIVLDAALIIAFAKHLSRH